MNSVRFSAAVALTALIACRAAAATGTASSSPMDPLPDDVRDCEGGACSSTPDGDIVAAPGVLDGQWLVRLAREDGKKGPIIIRLDLVHAKDSPRASGQFDSRVALCTGIPSFAEDCPYDGVKGPISDAMVEVGHVVIHFNPSADAGDEEALSLSRNQDGSWNGNLAGEGRTLDVIMRLVK